MVKKVGFVSISLETLIAVLIALASLATALAAWRTNVVNSQASEINRSGLITAIKTATTQGEIWRRVYQEAGYARDYLIEVAAVEALESSGDNLANTTAINLRQYLLTNLITMAEPMGNALEYRKANGTLDTQKRFFELNAQDGHLTEIDPTASFQQAAQFHQEQRFLTVGVVLLAASLFWLGMAEISPGRTKLISLGIGICGFLGTLGYFAVVEAVFALVHGGLL